MRMLLIGRGKMGTLIQQTAQAAGDEVVAALAGRIWDSWLPWERRMWSSTFPGLRRWMRCAPMSAGQDAAALRHHGLYARADGGAGISGDRGTGALERQFLTGHCGVRPGFAGGDRRAAAGF